MKIKCDPPRLPQPPLPPTKAYHTPPSRSVLFRDTEEAGRKRRQMYLEKKRRGGKLTGRPSVWTPDRDAQLKEMYLAGKTYGEIEKVVKVSKRAVMDRVHVLKSRGELEKIERKAANAWSDEEVSKLIELSSRGLYPREIAPQIGRTVGACSSKLSDLVKQGKVGKRRNYQRH